MKLTYCSYVNAARPIGDGLFECTVVILEGHHEPLDAANICLANISFGGHGEFYAWPVPEEHEAQYAPHVGRAIPGEEARALFDACTVKEWDERDEEPNSKALDP